MKDKILYLLQDTSRLTEVSKKEILQWLEQYPFYTPLHLLLQKKEEMLKRTGSETPFKSAVYFHNDIDFNALEKDLIINSNTPVISHELASDDLEDSIEIELSETEEVKYNSESELLLAELETEESVENIEFVGLAGAGAVVNMDIAQPELTDSVDTIEEQIVPIDYAAIGLAGAGSVVNLDIPTPDVIPVETEQEEVPELTPLDYTSMGLAGAGDVIENDHVPEYHVEEEIFNIEHSPYENVSLEDADGFIAERELLVADYSDELGFTDPQDQLENIEEPIGAEQVSTDFEVEELLIDSGAHIATNTDDIPADIPEEEPTKDFHVAPTMRILSLNDVDSDENIEEDIYIGDTSENVLTENPLVDENEISRIIEIPKDIESIEDKSKKSKSHKEKEDKKKKKNKKPKSKKKKNKSSFTKWLSESKQLKNTESKSKSKKKKQKKHKLKEREIIKEANKSNFRDESIISETLAEILGKQGHFQDSIDMYRQLSLLYPEKSAYFALKIEELNKLSK